MTLTHPSHSVPSWAPCPGPASAVLCDPGQNASPLWASAFPSAWGEAGGGTCRPEAAGRPLDSWVREPGSQALGLKGQWGRRWEQGGDRVGWRLCLQLAAPGNPQAKVNPALAETRTAGASREP